MDDKELIQKYKTSNQLFHLSKTLIDCQNFVTNFPQLLAMGFNVGGRPDGLWIAPGSTWLDKADSMHNTSFPNCCYIYEVNIPDSKMTKIKIISSDEDFDDFDKEFSGPGDNYWLNMDYFTMDFMDYLTSLKIHSERKCILNLCKLRRLPGESTWDILIKNKIIFADQKSAIDNCEFFKKSGIDVDRFRYKNWARVAKKYDGIQFLNWGMKSSAIQHFWFQSLDIVSGCIWNMTDISLKLLYEKSDQKWH